MQQKNWNNTEFSERTDALATALNRNITDIPDLIGIGKTMFFSYRKGTHPISSKAWNKLKKAELESTSKSSLPIPVPLSNEQAVRPHEGQLGQSVQRHIPLLGLADAGLIGQREYVDIDTAHHQYLTMMCPDPEAIAIVVEGDSMEPEYQAGDQVVVMPSYKPTAGGLCVARLKTGDTLFKKFLPVDPIKGIIKLASFNELYPPLTLSEEEFEWCYPVFAVQRVLWRGR